jgi:hypothetical protein
MEIWQDKGGKWRKRKLDTPFPNASTPLMVMLAKRYHDFLFRRKNGPKMEWLVFSEREERLIKKMADAFFPPSQSNHVDFLSALFKSYLGGRATHYPVATVVNTKRPVISVRDPSRLAIWFRRPE